MNNNTLDPQTEREIQILGEFLDRAFAPLFEPRPKTSNITDYFTGKDSDLPRVKELAGDRWFQQAFQEIRNGEHLEHELKDRLGPIFKVNGHNFQIQFIEGVDDQETGFYQEQGLRVLALGLYEFFIPEGEL